MESQTEQSGKLAPPGAAWLWSLRVLALGAMAIAAYLTFYSLVPGRPAGCGGDSACAEVLSSPWSKWMGKVPVSGLALVAYIVVLAATVFFGDDATAEQRRQGWLVLTGAAVMILGAVIWFVCLQVFAIGSICPWCMGDHALGVAVTGMILVRAPISFSRSASGGDADALIGRKTLGRLIAVGLLGVVLIVIGQTLVKPKGMKVEDASNGLAPPGPGPQPNTAPPGGTTPKPGSGAQIYVPENGGEIDAGVTPAARGGPKRVVRLYGEKIKVELPLPLLGSMEADHVVLDLFDYCCLHCRKMHGYMSEVHERFGDQLALVAMPIPLHPDCNTETKKAHPGFEEACDLARLAMAVWVADPDSFEEMHNWLFMGSRVPTAKDARKFAVDLVGAQPLREALADPWIDRQIRGNVVVHKGTYGKDKKSKSLPKLIYAKGVATGTPKNAKELESLLESALGLKAMAARVSDE